MPQFKADLHMHTIASSDGRSTLEDMVASAKKRGMDAVLISDHNVFALEKTRIIDGVLAIAGCEISTTSGHILALFCKPFHVKSLPKTNGARRGAVAPVGNQSAEDTVGNRACNTGMIDSRADITAGLPSAETAIEAIHANGGIAVVAHPFQNPRRDIDALANILDGVECANARVYMKNKDGNRMAEEFAKKHALFRTGGSDAHHESEVGNCYTLVEADSLEEIEAAIRSGRTTSVEEKKTKRIAKGLSQMTSAWRSGKIKKIFKATQVLAKGIVFDILGR